MRQVSVSELKNRLSQYLRLVKRGEVVEILERSVPIARIEPLAAQRERDGGILERLVRDGMVVRARRRPPRELGSPIPCSGDAVAVLVEERGER